MITVIVGGQFGSEGKGKVAHYFAQKQRASIAIRVGGSNSGHTVVDRSGRRIVFRVLPTAAILENTICVLPAGSYIDVDQLLSELELANLPPERFWIDPNAYILTEEHKREEQRRKLNEKIGSTQSGTGAAVLDRIVRSSALHLAANDKRLSKFIEPVPSLLRERLRRHERVIIEGTQGFGLSLLHSSYYPKVTSRDTTAASFVSEAGLSPLDVDQIILVLRAFPIRVPGASGQLPNEINWETVTSEGKWSTLLREYTSVTGKMRRVGRFDCSIVRQAIMINNPTLIVVNHVDYFDASSRVNGVTPTIEARLRTIESELGHEVDYIGLGPGSLVPRRTDERIVRLRG